MNLTATPLPLVVVTQPIHHEVRTRLSAVARLVINEGPQPWSREALVAHLAHADAMLAFMTDSVDAELLSLAPQLRLVACALKGHDNFDIDACTRAGVWVTNVPDLLTEPTAELALGLAIAAARHMLEGNSHVRSGQFQGWRPMLYGMGLHRSTAAVIGLGAVGEAIVDRLRGFGCARILGVDPHRQIAGVAPSSLDDALSMADYVFVAAPLTQATLKLISAERLQLSPAHQVLVNVGRGSVVDESAVAAALREERLGAYAADVFAMEDWALADRPRAVHPDLLSSPRTLLTPHIGSAVRSVRLAIEQRAADSVVQVLRGDVPTDAVNQPARSNANRIPVQPVSNASGAFTSHAI
jgi:phosphonate dehydrogenase